jgi:hypothetical protein
MTLVKMLDPVQKNFPRALLYSTVLFLVFGFITAVLESPWNLFIRFIRMTPATPLDYVFLFTTSVLAGIYMAVPGNCRADKKAFGGGLFGFLSFSCPTCNYLLVLLFGSAFLLQYLDPLRPFIGASSVVFLLYSLYRKLH